MSVVDFLAQAAAHAQKVHGMAVTPKMAVEIKSKTEG